MLVVALVHEGAGLAPGSVTLYVRVSDEMAGRAYEKVTPDSKARPEAEQPVRFATDTKTPMAAPAPSGSVHVIVVALSRVALMHALAEEALGSKAATFGERPSATTGAVRLPKL